MKGVMEGVNSEKQKKPEKPWFDVRDACLLAGFLMIGTGIWLIYHPAALIVCGGMVLWLGLPPKRTPQTPQERRRE